MTTYRVPGTMTISIFVDVDAETIEEAKAKAEEAPVRRLCHSCAERSDGEWSTSGELDGTPTIEGDEIIEVDAKRRRR